MDDNHWQTQVEPCPYTEFHARVDTGRFIPGQDCNYTYGPSVCWKREIPEPHPVDDVIQPLIACYLEITPQ